MKFRLAVGFAVVSAAVSAPIAVADTGSLWQGTLRAIRPTSIAVGRVTCVRSVPLDLHRFHVGQLVIIRCDSGKLISVAPGRVGLYVGVVPIAPAGR